MGLLKEKYDYETTTSTIQLFKEFSELKMEEGQPVTEHISRFEMAYAHIYSRFAISSRPEAVALRSFLSVEQVKVMYLFLSLPPWFNNIIDNPTTKDSLKCADVNRRLLDLNAIRPLDAPTTAKAYFGNEKSTKGEKIPECTYCKKNREKYKGNIYNKCRKLQAFLEQKSNDKGKSVLKYNKVNVVYVPNDELSEVILSNTLYDKAFLSTSTNLTLSWILDSGCLAHMTSQKELFNNLQPHKGVVTIANGQRIRVEGKGSLSLILWTSTGDKIPATIPNILYVPELKGGNLISESQLEAGRPTLKKVAELSSSKSIDYLSDSDLEFELDIAVKDDSRRVRSSKGKQRSVASREKKQKQKAPVFTPDDDTDDEANSALAKEADSKVAPHMVLITESTYHISFAPVTHPDASYFVPWCGNFFSVLFFMSESLCSSTLVQERIPDFFSPALYWYGSMVFILQILRAKEAASTITRDERQVLQTIIRTYPLEQWTILSPMIGFLQTLGSVKPTDPMYSWICPTFPKFNGFTAAHTYRGITLFPEFNEYHQFLPTKNAHIYPQETVTAQNQFVGLNESGVDTADYQCLTNGYGWATPPETGSMVTVTDLGLKIRTIRRWKVPDVPNNITVTSLKTFMGLNDDESIIWMSRILKLVNALTNFYPNSTNLANISPTTGLSSIADVDINRTPARVATDSWFRGRKGIFMNVLSPSGFDDPSQLRLSAATCLNASLAASTHAPLGARLEPLRAGPFFVNNDVEHNSVPLTQYKSGARTDPVIRFAEIIKSKLYDRKGGNQ
ncbi:hypothetical protein K3495_g8700 [Podosphaera aphanis]|nr:hypothetical protein K3495_g8700 [Podosphaera aphanis]